MVKYKKYNKVNEFHSLYLLA